MIALRPFTDDFGDGVRDLNARLGARGFRGTLYPAAPVDLGAGAAAAGLSRSYVLAVEDDRIVRGGYVLKQQEFLFPAGERRALGAFQAPVSEGVVDKRFALVGLRLLMDAMRRQPLAYTLGIGSLEEPLARMLASASWRLDAVGFFFRVVRPAAFLRHIRHLRTTSWRRHALDLLAATRLASGPIRAWHLMRDRGCGRDCESEVVESFGAWADDLFVVAAPAYSLVAVREAAPLHVLYPASDRRFVRLRVRRGALTVGWAVVMNNQLDRHRHFGSMRLGSIVDVLALPGSEAAVADQATRYLERDGADLIVSNQSHCAWSAALRSCGYLRGPSNFLFAASPGLVKALEPYGTTLQGVHMTRGDGDGPIHL